MKTSNLVRLHLIFNFQFANNHNISPLSGSNLEEKSSMTDAAVRPRLLSGSSEFVLTYEDKEGDWMLVGDVPWEYVSYPLKTYPF